MTALKRFKPEMELEAGRYISVVRHPFAEPEKTWVPKTATLFEMRDIAFEGEQARALARIAVDGVDIFAPQMAEVPTQGSYVEISLRAEKGVLRTFIKAFYWIGAFVVTFILTGGNVQAALLVANTIGNFIGNLVANALVPPPTNDNDNESAPKVYSIEGARNSARPGQAVPIILGKRRVFADVIVPFYQEVVGDDIYTVGAVCWACHDIALTDLKYGETPLVPGPDVQIQHSLTYGAPKPTLVPGIVVPSGSLNIDLDDTTWRSRTTAPDAEQIEIQLYFPAGVGWLKEGEKKKRVVPNVGVKIEYRLVGDTAWREQSAGTVQQADETAQALGAQTRRGLFGILGSTFVQQYHSALPQASGAVSLTRVWDRSAPGEPFPASVRFAVPTGQYEVRVRRLNTPKGTDDFFEDITWLAMNVWTEGDPLPAPELAVTAFRIKAGNQINGVVDTINGLAETLCPVYTPPAGGAEDATLANWSGSAPSSNPSDLLLFLSRGAHTKVPTPDVELNPVHFARFWQSNDDNGYKFDYVEPSTRRRGDLQQLCAGAGHARVLRIGGQVSPIIDGPKPQGNRTILSPDNAANFTFSKTFPPDVHALRVPFVNKATGYRNDEFFVYAPGYGPEADAQNNILAAEKFEQFSLPGKVEFDDIYASARRFLLNGLTQTLTGQCQQDIEGQIILRFGDRIGVRHSTIEVSGDSGRITNVTTNAAGNITGFTLSERPTLPAGELYVARWIKIGTDSDGKAYISADDVNHLTALAVDFGGQPSIETDNFTFASPVDGALGPEVGAICVVGILGQDVIDALVTDLEPLDDEAKSAIIRWTEYAPARFDGVATPPHTPLLPPVLNVRPHAPVITSYRATDEGIHVGFTIEARIGAVITGFEVSFRETADVGAEESPWQERPNAPASARTIRLPAGRPGQLFDVRIITLGQGGLESDPAIYTSLISYDQVVAPQNLTVTPFNIAGPTGASIPTLAVSVTAIANALIETLLVEAAVTGTGAWFSAGSTSANNTLLSLAGLTPGESYDVRAAWVNIRGALTSVADRPVVTNVTVSGNLIAGDTVAVGGQPAVNVLSEVAAATQGLLDAAQARADEAQLRLDGDVAAAQARADEAQLRLDGDAAEAAARAADIVEEVIARTDQINEVDSRLTGVIAGYLGSDGAEGGVNQNFTDLTQWSRTISTTDKDKYLALLASEAMTVDGVPAYATTAKRLLRTRYATACTGNETITVTARFKAITDGTTSGGTVSGYAYYWDAPGTTRVGFQTLSDQKLTVADGIVTIVADLTTHADAEWYSPYFFVNRITGENAQLAMLDIQYGGSAVLGSVQAAIAEEATARVDGDAALAQELSVVKATADGAATSSQLVTESTARADADSALSQQLSIVQATADDAATSAELLTESTARADADSALSQQLSIVQATADDAATSAELLTESTARADADSALSQQLSVVQATADDAATSAELLTESTARTDADTALGQRIDTVEATANGAATGAQLNSLAQASADADGALGLRIDTVEATANGAATSAQLNSLAQASADADTALAEQYDTLSATLDALAGTPLNENHNFNEWADPTAMPANWSKFGTSTVTRQVGEDGDYAIRVQTRTDAFSGFTQTVDVGAEPYTFKVKLKGISSHLHRSGIWLRIFDAASNSLSTHQYLLETLPDVDGVTSQVITNYREWEFSIPAQAGADTAWVRYYGHFSASGPANAIEIDTLELFGESADSADVSFLRSALSDGAGNFARAILNTAAGAARAFLEIGSVQRSDGTVDSNVGIGARRFEVSNPINGVWSKALEIVNGVVTVFGDLNALGAMRFGSRRIAVALQSFTVANLSDGDTVSFGGDLTNIPDYEFSLSGLDPLAAMEEYDLTLTGLTSTGGTVRAKIIGGGSPTSYSDGGSTSGSGSEPDEVLHKGNAADATNGNYTFTMNIQATYAGGIGEGFFAFGQLEFFVRSGGTWTSLGTEQWYDDRTSAQGGGSHASGGVTYVKNFSGAIGQTSDQEYGVSIVTGNGGSITAINSFTVAYSNTAAATTRTATPSGRKATVRIIPKNG